MFASCRGAILFPRLCPLLSRTAVLINSKLEEQDGKSSPDKKQTREKPRKFLPFYFFPLLVEKRKKSHEPLVLSLVFFYGKQVEAFCECSLTEKQ